MDYLEKIGGKHVVFRRFILVIILLLTFTLQNTGGLFPAPWGIKAILLVPLIISISMFEREFTGLFFGLAAGAMLDAFSSTTLFFHSLCFTFIGFIAGALITYVMRNNLTCAIILTAIITFLYNSLYFLVYYAFNNIDKPLYIYIKYYFLSFIYTTVFTPIFYFIVRAIVKKSK